MLISPINFVGYLPFPITLPSPLLFDANYPLTNKNSPPILCELESNVLSKISQIQPLGN